MRTFVILGTLLSLGLAAPTMAQNAANNPMSTPSMSKADPNMSKASISADLKQHLITGAEIYDTSGKRIGTLATVHDDGSLLIRESTGSPTTATRVLPAGSVSWNNRLETNLSADAIAKLPATK